MKSLDCGHFPSPHGKHATGTARFNNEEMCWDCAYKIEKGDAIKHGNIFAYLSEDGKKVTNWPGMVFSDNLHFLCNMTDNFGGERTYLRFRFNGDVWSGFAMGKGMYLRARKTKLKSLY